LQYFNPKKTPKTTQLRIRKRRVGSHVVLDLNGEVWIWMGDSIWILNAVEVGVYIYGWTGIALCVLVVLSA